MKEKREEKIFIYIVCDYVIMHNFPFSPKSLDERKEKMAETIN